MAKMATVNTEAAVYERYAAAASPRTASLCCPVDYDADLLKVIPKEILERDYGCGDPSRHVRPGDIVLDLGCGTRKICYIAAQLVGPTGSVIGVDSNDKMLAVARRHQPEIARKLGYDNVRFLRGKIQDIATPLDELEAYLASNPVRSGRDLEKFESYRKRLLRRAPLVADDSVDIVVSNCVLNLVRTEDKARLFTEIFRVLKRGGRVAISDIVLDEDVPAPMQNDSKLWSRLHRRSVSRGPVSGSVRSGGASHAIEMEKYGRQPWQTIRGIEFRSITVTARKGKQGPCRERKQAVIYQGPWKKVEDDDGHVLLRGKRMAVCDKTFQILTSEPYAGQILPVEPVKPIPLEKATAFACKGIALRDPKETKGHRYRKTIAPTSEAFCGPEGSC